MDVSCVIENGLFVYIGLILAVRLSFPSPPSIIHLEIEVRVVCVWGIVEEKLQRDRKKRRLAAGWCAAEGYLSTPIRHH